jgi:hypothetical protein
LSGTQEEIQGRTATRGPITETGAYHFYWTADYDMREYENCPRDECTAWWWDPQFWEGDIYQASSYSYSKNSYAKAMGPGPYTRTSGQTESFGDSFNLEAISNTSMGEYGSITTQSYELDSSTSCSATDYIEGNNSTWNNVAEVITICAT